MICRIFVFAFACAAGQGAIDRSRIRAAAGGVVKAADIAPDIGLRTFLHAVALRILRGHIEGAGGCMERRIVRTAGAGGFCFRGSRGFFRFRSHGAMILLAVIGAGASLAGGSIAAGIVMAAVFMGAEELITAIVAVHDHTAFMVAGNLFRCGGIASA